MLNLSFVTCLVKIESLYFTKANVLNLFRCFPVSGCEAPQPLLNGGVTLLSGSQNQHGSVIQYHCNEPFYSFPQGENGKTIHRVNGINGSTSQLKVPI